MSQTYNKPEQIKSWLIVVEFGVKNNEPRFYLFWLIISLAAVAQMQLNEKEHEILCK